MRPAVILLVAAFSLSGCYRTTRRNAVRHSAITSIDVSLRDAVWTQAITRLREEQFVIESLDETHGFIRAINDARETRCGPFRCLAEDRLILHISPQGEVRLDVLRRIVTGNGSYPAVVAPEWTQDLEREQMRLLELVLAE